MEFFFLGGGNSAKIINLIFEPFPYATIIEIVMNEILVLISDQYSQTNFQIGS